MRAVKGKDTKPEMRVRRMIHGMGYRYRLHRKDLPGKPDLVFPTKKKIIFVHGCFWHGHSCSRGARVPKSNRDYWISKINRNRDRDAQSNEALLNNGWRVLTIWECELKDGDLVSKKVRGFLQ
jgi:DNA mismatch endonuclease, patch repair protein